MNQLLSVTLCVLVFGVCTPSTWARTCRTKSTPICCPPDKVNGTMLTDTSEFSGDGSTNRITAVYDINIDYENRQISVRGSSSVDQAVHLVMRPNVTFVIDEKTESCVLNYTIPFKEKYCLPGDAAFLGFVMYGGLNTSAYRVVENGYNLFTTITHECIAINRHETKIDPALSTVTSTVYSNVKPVVDDSSFVIPSYCPSPATARGPDGEL